MCDEDACDEIPVDVVAVCLGSSKKAEDEEGRQQHQKGDNDAKVGHHILGCRLLQEVLKEGSMGVISIVWIPATCIES